MGLVDTLKWLWDPRTDEQKRYETDPLRRYTQHLTVYIKGVGKPFERYIEFEDSNFGDWYIRVDLDDDIREWLNNRAKKGIKVDDVWYPPDMIERIELGEHTVEEIKE
jgi:hypothetical protein